MGKFSFREEFIRSACAKATHNFIIIIIIIIVSSIFCQFCYLTLPFYAVTLIIKNYHHRHRFITFT